MFRILTTFALMDEKQNSAQSVNAVIEVKKLDTKLIALAIHATARKPNKESFNRR